MRTHWMIGLLALSIGCDPPPAEGCRSAADCEGAQVCIDGTCTAAPDAPSVDAPADTTCTCAPGGSCASGVCAMDCGDPLATHCASGDECDFATGACVAEGTAGALTGDGVTCGSARCMPGSECGLGDICIAAPPCASMRCNADRSVCWGSVCTSTRPVASCTPASIERMSMPDFLRGGDNGLVDLELDDACNVYGVTTISGVDYLRELAPDGTLTEHPGVTNLNMGEVAVLRPFSSEFEESPGEVALTYTCCLTCGCVGADPQGVARLDREGSVRLPMVLTAVASDATGPFGVRVLDGGPYGLTWGRDRTLYVGNVMVDGDLHRADLTTGTSGEIARLGARIHATTTFAPLALLVATAGGSVLRVATDGEAQGTFAELGQDVTSLVRDPFLGVVYLSLRDGSVVRRTASGEADGELVPAGGAPGRIAYGPDGALYYLRTGYPSLPTVERIELPTTR